MKKHYIYLSAFGAFLGIVFLVTVFVSQSSSKQKPTGQSTGVRSTVSDANVASKIASSFFPDDPTDAEPVDPTVAPLLPEGVALAFYQWYTGSSASPLISGTYKLSPYLSNEYKEEIASVIGPAYRGTYDPIFCMQNRTKELSASDPQYNPAGDTAELTLQKNDGFAVRDLYKISLVKNKSNQWVITDSICVPQKR